MFGFTTPSKSSPASTPSTMQDVPSPAVSLESWIMDVEDLQDKLDAVSVSSSVASSASEKVFRPLMNGLSSIKNSLAFDFVFPSLEDVFPQ